MKFWPKKKKEQKQYNITATKETKQFDLKVTLRDGGYWNTTFATSSDLNLFLKQLEDKDTAILTFQEDKKHHYFLHKDKIIHGSCLPEKIKISECFTYIGDALGFIETLELDKWKEISGLK